MATVEEQASLFSLLADPTRLKLLGLLQKQHQGSALCVNALAYQLDITQSAVSQHLRILKSAGLVKGEKRGYRVHYFIDDDAISKAQKIISLVLQNKDGLNTGTITE
jgi:ArsR family transcriptional regulator, arsenate/arsenite/antimonite-responsive transcriptional repressor